jgi:hypothetical protein
MAPRKKPEKNQKKVRKKSEKSQPVPMFSPAFPRRDWPYPSRLVPGKKYCAGCLHLLCKLFLNGLHFSLDIFPFYLYFIA